ncbi:MAG: DinB family protein [Phycisphaera sp.]|nr:MAG: DinB family protein [Phycisphaera sp.]
MDADRLISMLESFPPMLRASVQGLAEDEFRWKPDSGAWSVLEIVCHVADEEIEDFRPRVLGTLADPSKPWSPIDPEGVAVQRRYNDQDLFERVDQFDSERSRSVEQLRALADLDWELAYGHPQFGPIRAGDVMLSWVAHDMLHLRQIAKRRFELAADAGSGFDTAYAGTW